MISRWLGESLWKLQIQFDSIKILLWYIVINTDFSALFWQLQVDFFSGFSLMVHSLHRTLKVLPKANQILLPADLQCWVSLPACASRSLVFRLCLEQSCRDSCWHQPAGGQTHTVLCRDSVLSGDKSKHSGKAGCVYVQSDFHMHIFKLYWYLSKLRRSLSITGVPWRKINHATCSENCTYFSPGRFTRFQ